MSADLYRGEAIVTWHGYGDGVFERAVVFEPGYNDTEPHRYGKHGMGVRFLLRGPKGATQFVFNTGWVPGVDGVAASLAAYYPTGWDLGHHAIRPQYEGEGQYGVCTYLPGETECFYDGSGISADALLKEFIREGESVVWARLREDYDRLDAGAES